MNIDDAALAESLRRLTHSREDNGSVVSALEAVLQACVDLFDVGGAGLLVADDSVATVVAVLGLWWRGCIPVVISPMLTDDEVRRIRETIEQNVKVIEKQDVDATHDRLGGL